jgi:hypothetical protein
MKTEDGAIVEFRIRPRFETTSNKSVEEISRKMKTLLDSGEAPCEGKVRLGYISLEPKENDRHFWSPHLSVTIETSEEDDSVSIIRGLYGPNPTVWTMFVFFYSIIGILIMIATIIGFANRSIGESCMILWLVPILIMVFLSLYLTSYIGQKKGHDQVEELHHFLEYCIGHDIGRIYI